MLATPLAAQDIHTAALENDTAAVRVALANGVNPNEYNLTGFAPLHSAARSGNVVMARLLVENGAVVNARTQTSGSDTPLYFATLNNHTAMINFLLENGADPTIKNNFGATPFENAAVTVDNQTARLLAAAGASIALLGRFGYDADGEPLGDRSVFGALFLSLFFDIPLATSERHYAPFSSEFILRDLFLHVGGQLLFALSPTFAIGAESGAAISASSAQDHIHLEIPARFVASLVASRSLTFQAYGGTHLMFPNVAAGGDAVFRFDVGARAGFGSGIGQLIVDLSYVLPVVIATSRLPAAQFTSATQSANSIRVGVGWRIRL